MNKNNATIFYSLFPPRYVTCGPPQGTTKTACEFKIGLMGMGFTYFLLLTHEPKYDTVTWTLDYKYNSDFGM